VNKQDQIDRNDALHPRRGSTNGRVIPVRTSFPFFTSNVVHPTYTLAPFYHAAQSSLDMSNPSPNLVHRISMAFQVNLDRSNTRYMHPGVT
jgi:hypothetical protein